MGFKKTAVITLTLVCLVLFTVTARAESVENLYDVYGIDYEVTMPQEITDTIKKYNEAQRYVKMYHYVASSIFDKNEIKKELSIKEKELSKIEKEIRSGYNKSLTEIYALEDSYLELLDDVDRLRSSLSDYQPDWSTEVSSNVPDYSGYMQAKKDKDEIISSSEIGTVSSASLPIASQALLLDNSKDFTVYKTVNGAGVKAMFNGTVKSIEEIPEFGLTVTVDCNNGVLYYVCNMSETTVKVGDTVYQGQTVGYISGTKAVFRLKLGDTFVDVSKLYKQEE